MPAATNTKRLGTPNPSVICSLALCPSAPDRIARLAIPEPQETCSHRITPWAEHIMEECIELLLGRMAEDARSLAPTRQIGIDADGRISGHVAQEPGQSHRKQLLLQLSNISCPAFLFSSPTSPLEIRCRCGWTKSFRWLVKVWPGQTRQTVQKLQYSQLSRLPSECDWIRCF